MSGGDQALKRCVRRRAKLDTITCVHSHLHEPRSELITPAAVLRQVTARFERVDQTMSAAAGEAQPATDLGDCQAALLAGQQLENVEGPVRRLDR